MTGGGIGGARHALTAPADAPRLDLFVATALDVSRTQAATLIATGCVTVNGAAERASYRPASGDQVVVEIAPTTGRPVTAEDIPLVIAYEDEDVLVVDKPAGMVVHPAPGNWSGTLLNGLLALDPKAVSLPRAGIVHRLDKDTSGLMVIARTRAVMDALVHLIAEREVSRQYVALAHRPWVGPNAREVAEPIGRDPRNRLRMAVVNLEHQSGKTAKTRFELLQNAEKGCWLRCTLFTGRTHQIRVHAAHMGHPLVADDVYGGSAAAAMSRQALHADRLAFKHPVTGEAMALSAPLPADMKLALENWGLGYNGSKWDL